MIDGWQEGVFSLLAANYLKSQLFTDSFNPHIDGVIDVGGASAQIAFLPDDFQDNQFGLQQVNVASSLYPLYSHSYLCYGTAQVLNMYSAKYIRDNAYSTSNLASCYPDGYDFKYTGAELADLPCVNGMVFESDRPFTLDTLQLDSKKTYIISGNSKKNKCRDEVKQMFPSTLECPFGEDRCGIDGVYQAARSTGNKYLVRYYLPFPFIVMNYNSN